MSETKYTQEPWSIVKNSWQYTTIHNESGEAICTLDLEDWGVTEENQDELEARQAKVAAKIAAAPELYEALETSDALIVKAQSILAEYIVPDSGISDSEVIGSLLGLLDGPEQRITQSVTKAALAKARGE